MDAVNFILKECSFKQVVQNILQQKLDAKVATDLIYQEVLKTLDIQDSPNKVEDTFENFNGICLYCESSCYPDEPIDSCTKFKRMEKK